MHYLDLNSFFYYSAVRRVTTPYDLGQSSVLMREINKFQSHIA